MAYMYNIRYVADSTSVVINESILKSYAGLSSDLRGSVSTDLSVQILHDEGDFYTQVNTISMKIYKKIENYSGETKEHLDNIYINGLTIGDTYKIIISYKRTNASGTDTPL